MQEINLIFGARNGEFRITAIMLNNIEKNGLYNTITWLALSTLNP